MQYESMDGEAQHVLCTMFIGLEKAYDQVPKEKVSLISTEVSLWNRISMKSK